MLSCEVISLPPVIAAYVRARTPRDRGTDLPLAVDLQPSAVVATPRAGLAARAVPLRHTTRPTAVVGDPTVLCEDARQDHGVVRRLRRTESPCPGPLAQLVEHRTFNPLVQGSSPWRPTSAPVSPPRLRDLTGLARLGRMAPHARPAPPESHVRAIACCPRRNDREPGQRASALRVPGGQRRAHRCRHVRRQLDAGPSGGRPRGQLPGAVVGPPAGAVPRGDRPRPPPPRAVAGTARPGPHRRRGPAPRAYALDPRTPAARGRRDLGLLRRLRRLPQPQVPAAAGAGHEVRQRAARAGPPPAVRARPRDPDAGPLRDRRLGARAVRGLPRLHPPRGDPGDRVAGLVAQHQPRLVVRHRAGDRVDARRGVLLPAADAGPGDHVPLADQRPHRPTARPT